MSAALVLASLLASPSAASAVSAPAAEAAPMTVRVEAADRGGPAVAEWASELGAALAARRDEFRLVKPGEKAELVVKLESVGQAADGTPSLQGALVIGETTRPFTYGFNDVQVEAEKLARNLRKLADQMKAAGR